MFFVFLGNFVYWSPQLVTKSVFLTFFKDPCTGKDTFTDRCHFRLVKFGGDPHTVQEEICRLLLALS
jgi:hypothetical protein